MTSFDNIMITSFVIDVCCSGGTNGVKIVPGVAQTIYNLVARGMTPTLAVDFPRVYCDSKNQCSYEGEGDLMFVVCLTR